MKYANERKFLYVGFMWSCLPAHCTMTRYTSDQGIMGNRGFSTSENGVRVYKHTISDRGM